MTTATSAALPRRRARLAAAAAGLTAALLLTACTDDGGGDSGNADASAAPSATGADASGGGSGSSGEKTELEGNWLATTDGKAVALIVSGEQAAVFETGGAMCSGTTAKKAGERTVRLTCTGGKGERTVGTVGPVSASSLTITWEGSVGEEKYRKADGAQLPTELATAGS